MKTDEKTRRNGTICSTQLLLSPNAPNLEFKRDGNLITVTITCFETKDVTRTIKTSVASTNF